MYYLILEYCKNVLLITQKLITGIPKKYRYKSLEYQENRKS